MYSGVCGCVFCNNGIFFGAKIAKKIRQPISINSCQKYLKRQEKHLNTVSCCDFCRFSWPATRQIARISITLTYVYVLRVYCSSIAKINLDLETFTRGILTNLNKEMVDWNKEINSFVYSVARSFDRPFMCVLGCKLDDECFRAFVFVCIKTTKMRALNDNHLLVKTIIQRMLMNMRMK